jgi:hypothetical protein
LLPLLSHARGSHNFDAPQSGDDDMFAPPIDHSLLGNEHASQLSAVLKREGASSSFYFLWASRKINLKISNLTNSRAANICTNRLHSSATFTHINPAYLQAPAAAAVMATTIYIKNIGAQTADQEIKDFFSFW